MRMVDATQAICQGKSLSFDFPYYLDLQNLEATSMYVTYFDEVKANPSNGQHTYLVGGIAVPIADIKPLEAAVTELSREIFGSPELTKANEFHASHIYFGKGPWSEPRQTGHAAG